LTKSILNPVAKAFQLRLKLHYFDKLWIRWTTSRTTSRHVGMLWICCRPSTWYGLVRSTTCCRLSISCEFVVQLVVQDVVGLQQIHNESKQEELGPSQARSQGW